MIQKRQVLLLAGSVLIILAFVIPFNEGCSGSARCISGTLKEVIDGNTILVDEYTVKLSLSSSPTLEEFDGLKAKEFLESICSIGSTVLIDEDDLLPQSQNEITALVKCNGNTINEQMLNSGNGIIHTDQCYQSEFSTFDWAKKYGC